MIDAPGADAPSLLQRLLTTPSLLSELLLAQLALAFVVSSTRPDPFAVAPLIALYALREADRRAMMLYLVVSAATCLLDLFFLGSAPSGFMVKLLSFAALVLKVALLYPALKAHDALPATRLERVDPAQLQASVADTVEAALLEELQKLSVPKPARLPAPQSAPTQAKAPSAAAPVVATVPAPAPPPRPPQATPNTSWDEV
jgi:hypothetical protein